MSWLRLPPRAKTGEPVKAEHFNMLRDAVRAVALLPGVGYFLKRAAAGTTMEIRGAGGSGQGTGSSCPFGRLVPVPAEGETPAGTAIRGGVLTGGAQIWNVPANAVNLAVETEVLVWLVVGVTANNEDGLPLPGINTSTEPTWATGTVAGGYPDTVQPDVSNSFIGTAIVPIGKLTVAGGGAILEAVACGNVTVGYCPTNLSVTRS